MELGNENLQFLRTSLQAFERGQLFEIKRVASTIRTIVHDTDNSLSIIKQIEDHPDNRLNETMMFFDRGGIPESVCEGIVIYVDCQVPIIKLGISKEDFLATFGVYKNKEHWWNRMILACQNNTKKRIWSRKDLVLKYANKEGGSHVDPKMPTDHLSAQDSMKYITDDYEIGIGYVAVFEAGISLAISFNNYLEKIKILRRNANI